MGKRGGPGPAEAGQQSTDADKRLTRPWTAVVQGFASHPKSWYWPKSNKVHPEIHPDMHHFPIFLGLDQIWISQEFWPNHVKSIEADPAPQASRWAAMSVSPTGDASGLGTDLWLADQDCGLLRTKQGVSPGKFCWDGISRGRTTAISVFW